MQREQLSRVLDGDIASTVHRFTSALAREGFRVVQSIDLSEVVGKATHREVRPLVVLSVIEPAMTAAVSVSTPAKAPATVMSFTVRETISRRIAIDGPDCATLDRVANTGGVDV